GVFRALERPVYEDSLQAQIDAAQESKGQGDLQTTLVGGGSWVVE
ncbi:MAG: 2-oxoacid:ferredoxin oxidoreductase subunit beta, partial [Opitutae bacterium]|nr:2-oxoacid:ferredoxin oxidoreductase subunit beta [Opitutae bacterium]